MCFCVLDLPCCVLTVSYCVLDTIVCPHFCPVVCWTRLCVHICVLLCAGHDCVSTFVSYCVLHTILLPHTILVASSLSLPPLSSSFLLLHSLSLLTQLCPTVCWTRSPCLLSLSLLPLASSVLLLHSPSLLLSPPPSSPSPPLFHPPLTSVLNVSKETFMCPVRCPEDTLVCSIVCPNVS